VHPAHADLPALKLVYVAEVEIAPRQDLGSAPGGLRFLVPILGGRFDGPMGLRGTVMPGGADRQLLRPDGIKELDALYDLQTDDGAVITVRNRVLVDESRTPQRYARSVVRLVAPDGPHAWINRRLFVGTLESLRPQRSAVRLHTYLVD
jgi:hypothetical protein